MSYKSTQIPTCSTTPRQTASLSSVLQEQKAVKPFLEPIQTPFYSDALTQENHFYISDPEYPRISLILDEYRRQTFGETSCGRYSSAYHQTIENSSQVSQLQQHIQPYQEPEPASSPEVVSNGRTQMNPINVAAASSSAIIVAERRTKRAGQSANGTKKRNPRTAFSSDQLEALEQAFNREQYQTLDDRAMLSDQLGISEKTIKIWFQNRRSKQKKMRLMSGDFNGEKSIPKSFPNQRASYCFPISYTSTFANPASYHPPTTAYENYDYFSNTQYSSTHFQQQNQNVNQTWPLPSNASFSYYPTTSPFDGSNNSCFNYQYLQQQPLPQQQSMNRGNYGHFE